MLQARFAVFAIGAIACGDNLVTESKITGQVFSDDNGNGVKDDGEPGIPDITVVASPSDLTTTTDSDGNYQLSVTEPGTYEVRQVLPFGFRASTGQAKPQRTPIIGGSDTTAGQYGFMVSIGQRFSGGVFPFCGGVLISDRHVVTAAHCSQGESASRVGVIAGTLDPFDGGQVFDVESIEVHPDFPGDPELGFDISVWTLKEPIDLKAAGLNTVEMLTPANAALATAGKLATTLGWGVSDRDSVLLQQVHVPVVAEQECAAVYPDATAFDTQICAGAPEGGIDSCQGDSGGPLLVRDDARGVWMHAGITSYGDGCALPDVPGVYGRVSALSGWAMTEALEPGATKSVTLSDLGQVATADFATRITTRPQVGEIEKRWQLTGTTLADTVGANTAVSVHWSILGEDDSMTGFTCQFDPDLAGTIAAQDVACGLGGTDLQFAGFPTGIFATALNVTRDGLTLSRRVDVVSGTPAATNSGGALATTDPLDVDYNDPYRVDYYDVSGLAGTKAFAIEAESSAFGMFLTLYDLDQRDFVNGGGILAVGSTTSDGKERIVVVPEAGKSYLVGVSSQNVNETGTYVVSILNDGVLTAR